MSGFTLIETLIVLLLIGILVQFAVPNYQRYRIKSLRSEAAAGLLQIQLAQSRYYASHGRYANKQQLAWPTSRHYRFSVAAINTHGYKLQAHAQGQQAQDTHCKLMQLYFSGGLTEKSPIDCWQ